MELMNKVVIITGAGTGVGRAAAIKLAAEGAKVVINYNKSEKEAHKVVNEIKQNGGIAIAYKANVANEKEVKELVSQTVQTFGSIDGLVNNASITAQIAMDDLDAVTDDIWDSLFSVNAKGMFYCIKAVVPYMKKQHFGAIVNMGSVAGMTGIGSSIPYAATKSAIHTMTKSLAIALAPSIRVNSISPGAVETRWWAGNEEKMYQLTGELPLQRISTPDDIAEAIVFQLTQKSITGQVFTIDNGQTL
ncbi:3-ketoacyl-acyl carrier protein reductase [Niallia circulans]|uniref:SDR family NAD(P)-dependent oxidoreductase n=1 Tax=Niallia circulans TaxID=1397 RepID=UPI00077C4996|nr:SDR family oxidoreductase [Niallia circulans]MDR4315289.1 SDR family oxidoreductase [Niallia circulans]MED3841749.1 SDR family oxidoreductase [Niallia circulans]MED4245690.1 SDR family oxidoreductase [Niallia circulans]MED4248176.1 SDR family oxidoreductase [Niallia circulans]QKH61365.1 SDR family oxidoreductase [Niallia circulans]